MNLVSDSTKEAFGRRLREAMGDLGHGSTRAKSGVDVGPLVKAATVTREMARRYVNGAAIPETNKIAAIAKYLGVRVAWLRDGEGAKHAVQAAKEQSGPYTVLSEEALELARVWSLLPDDRRALFKDVIFSSAVVHGLLPWLRTHRPASSSYAEFERAVQRDFARLGGQLRLFSSDP
jgi:transcriptional regulator with XRE-family HTH domain